MKTATRRKLFLPHAFVHRAGELVFDSVVADDTEFDHPAVNEHELDVSAAGTARSLCLRVTYRPPPSLWDTLPLDERGPEHVRVVLVAEDTKSLHRQHVAMVAGSSGEYRAEIRVNREDVGAWFEVHAVAARASARASGRDGRARATGARLAESPVWRVLLEEKGGSAGSFLTVRWADFSQSGHLRHRERLAWHLEITQDPPILWLNSETPDLKALLTSDGRHGARARARDHVFRTIAVQAWTALAATAITGSRVDEDGEWEYAHGWYEHVLAALSHLVPADLPKAKRRAAFLDEVRRTAADPTAVPLLMEEVTAAVADWLAVRATVENVMRELPR